MPYKSLDFKYEWRPYQKRVLDAIHEHLDDKRLHIVAAPGAGKTTLGIEIFRILSKPTLVMSPSRVIRDQWLDRLKDFSSENINDLDWISNTLAEPKILTSITYQALHSKFAKELSEEDEDLDENNNLDADELNDFIKIIKKHKIKILILDEAHHLRSQWWRALEKVCDYFPDIILVSLTATPPYGSVGQEWNRYEELCGPIDEEISVPELVKSGTLCAHQDYIWACDVTKNEKKQIDEYERSVFELCKTLFESDDFKRIVLSHDWLHKENIEQDLIKEPELVIAILSYIKEKGLELNTRLMSILDLGLGDVPKLSRSSWQRLIEDILFSKHYEFSDLQESFISSLKKQLRSSELLHKKELSLVHSRRLDRSLSLSLSKVKACVEIHNIEYETRRENLCQVILTDYIRDEELSSGLKTGEINLGAWPIFVSLSDNSNIPQDIALLTGRLSVVSSSKLNSLFKYIDKDKVKLEDIGTSGEYKKVTAPLNLLTSAFTQLLMSGDIKTLVGTRSLLGEGWDAPSINSLILASSVGSFMLTNQMRGRAIRIDKNTAEKVSSIWHLVSINVESLSGWSDYYNLRKRFETFVGLSEKDLTIESGFERMKTSALESYSFVDETAPLRKNNAQMLSRYKKIENVKDRWNKALGLDETARVIPSVKIEKSPRIRSYLLKESFMHLLLELGSLVSSVVIWVMYSYRHLDSSLMLFLLIAIVGSLLYKLPKTIAVVKTVFYHLPVDGTLDRMGKALAEALCETGLIETSIRQMKVSVIKLQDGSFYVSLVGSTFYESSLFSDCMAEILAPIQNQRYLVLREGKFLGISRDDYHAVPMKLAIKKEYAKIFYKSWCKNVSLSELIYTRTPEGKKKLLKAKMKAFSSIYKNKVKRQDRWQ